MQNTNLRPFLSAIWVVFLLNSLNLYGVHACETSRLTEPTREIINHKGQHDLIRVNILLEDQYDSQELYLQSRTQTDRNAKRQLVVSALQDHASRSQKNLLAFLQERKKDGQVEEIRPMWITNMINASLQPSVLEELKNHPDILVIDYDRKYDMLQITEPGFHKEVSHLPGKQNKSQPEPVWSVEKVNAPAAWEIGGTGQGIVVAVLDTGVNYNHADLEGNMWEHPDYPHHGYNFAENNYNTMDYRGHGTHCAGTVAGNGASGLITGVAPDAKIMAVKVLNDDGQGSFGDVVSGVEFAVNHGAHIISLSLGANIYNVTPEARSAMRGAFDNVLSAGVIAAAAAGNNGTSGNAPYRIILPGDIPPPWLHPDQTLTGGISSVVSVGSVTIEGVRSGFSSVGPASWQFIEPYYDYPFDPEMGIIRPDIVTPGTDIISLTHNDNNGYRTSSGTSMATPAVAGGLALMLSKEPELMPEQMAMILELSAYKKTDVKSNEYGSGLMDALRAWGETPYLNGIMYISHEIDDSEGNNDGVINPGETVNLNVYFKNVGETEVEEAQAQLLTYSDYINIIDDTTDLPMIAAGDSTLITGAFSFSVAENAPGNHPAQFRVETTFGQEGQLTIMMFTEKVHGPEVLFSDAVIITDDDNVIIQGETKELSVTLINNGQLETGALSANIEFESQHASVVSYEGLDTPSIQPGDSTEVRFLIHAHHDAPSNTNVVMHLSAESPTHCFTDTQDFYINKAQRFENGNIPTTFASNPTPNHSAEEPGAVSFSVPPDAIITGVDVSYSMTSQTGAIMNEQFSFIRCTSEGGTSEAQITQGEGNSAGTYHYQRSNLDIANGVEGGGDIEFELHAFRTWGGSGTNETFAFVNDASWTLAVQYEMPKHNVTFIVINHLGDHVEGAVINVGNTFLNTNQEGAAEFDLPKGLLYYNVSADKHLPVAMVPFNVSEEGENVFEIVLTRVFSATFDVKDIHGNAIENVLITVEDHTLDEGESSVSGLHEGIYSFVVEADHFYPHEGHFEIVDEDKNIEVVLEPDGTNINDLGLSDVKVFPNPTGHNIFVESEEIIEYVLLTDLMGKTIHSARVNANRYKINVSGLVAGMYFMQVKTTEATTTERVQIVR